jgi:hypothetical protein
MDVQQEIDLLRLEEGGKSLLSDEPGRMDFGPESLGRTPKG